MAEPSIPSASDRIGKAALINRLNYANFQNCSILVHFRHPRYERSEAYRARPLPCRGERLDCLWVGNPVPAETLRTQRFEHFHVVDRQSSLLVRPELLHLDEQGIAFRLPDYCEEVSLRRIARHAGKGIRARMIQNGMIYHGRLEDFSAISFRLQLESSTHCPFRLINPEADVQAILADGPEILFTGQCRIVKQGSGSLSRSIILEPLHQRIQRFRPKQFRGWRQNLNPAPEMLFRHPLTGKAAMLPIADLSGAGFAVEEDWHRAVLLPGMILPDVEINFLGSLAIHCRAQVIYSHLQDGDGSPTNRVKSGLSILDLSVAEHAKLMRLLPNNGDAGKSAQGRIDLDELWNFFFDSGLIAPPSYAFIQRNKHHIKATFRTLYSESPHIARHFICRDRHAILGHVAMARFFENSWLLHHHAMRKANMKRAGLQVLNQISRFVSDAQRFPAMHMDFLMCYFRPDNPFPQRIYGGIASFANNPKECSVDPFACLHHVPNGSAATALPAPWRIGRVHEADLMEMQGFYEQVSGGLMLQAIDLHAAANKNPELSAEYQRLGMQHRIFRAVLRKNGDLKAIFSINLSDIGLHLADLTRCIQVFVIDLEDLTREILFGALAQIAAHLRQPHLPALIYPLAAAERLGLNWDKIYNLWVIRTENEGQHLFRFLKRQLQSSIG